MPEHTWWQWAMFGPFYAIGVAAAVIAWAIAVGLIGWVVFCIGAGIYRIGVELYWWRYWSRGDKTRVERSGRG